MNKNKLKVFAGSLLLIIMCSCQQNPGSWKLESPDQQIRVEIREPATAPIATEPPNVSGEVHDSQGRLLTGIAVFVAAEAGGRIETIRSLTTVHKCVELLA